MNMEAQPREHLMQLEATHESGAEEWICPICGRRILIKWGPSFNWITLEGGDEFAGHSGAKGGISIQAIKQLANDELSADEELKLDPWKKWLEKIDFESLWNDDAE